MVVPGSDGVIRVTLEIKVSDARLLRWLTDSASKAFWSSPPLQRACRVVDLIGEGVLGWVGESGAVLKVIRGGKS